MTLGDGLEAQVVSSRGRIPRRKWKSNCQTSCYQGNHEPRVIFDNTFFDGKIFDRNMFDSHGPRNIFDALMFCEILSTRKKFWKIFDK